MDGSTKIGIGAGAALACIGLLGSVLINWWVCGPLMAICALVAIWGFLPAVGRWSIFDVPLEDAARRIYEAVEHAERLEDAVVPLGSPQTRLDHFKYVLLTMNDIELRGVKPPSTRARPISQRERRQLHPADGVPNGLAVSSEVSFIDVRVSRWGLWRAKRAFVAAAKGHGELLSRLTR